MDLFGKYMPEPRTSHMAFHEDALLDEAIGIFDRILKGKQA